MDDDKLKAFSMLLDMVRPEHRPRVYRLMTKEEREAMGIIPDNLDDAFEQAEAAKTPAGGGGLLPEGEYEGVVLAAEVGASVKPWVTAELKLKLQVDEGERSGTVTFADFELAPNTDRSGNPSPGKLGFLKGQLENLGYTGKLKDLELNAQQFVGARVKFRQKVDDHLTDNGEPDQYARMNPNTGKPYVDREVYINELLQPGFAQSPSAAAESPAEPAVY